MKTQQTALPEKKKDQTKTILTIGIIILILQMIFHLTVGAKSPSGIQVSDSLQAELSGQLNNQLLLRKLNFPKSVKRFYALNGTETNWLRPEQNIGPTASAMLLLDCVRQYGLQHENYHPEVLDYSLMHDVLSPKNIISSAQKVVFELMLSDAMISMINDLHYGRYNPNLSSATIDNGNSLQLKAEVLLLKFANNSNLFDSILTVQPKIVQYKQLQSYMKLIAGQYTCDSYETPESEIRAIAFNMERLRWNEVKSDIYLQVNIPSSKLSYISTDSIYEYKVVIGKVSTPTPTLLSQITYIETSYNIPGKVVFLFLSNGCIRVEHAESLAKTLLINDKQSSKVTLLSASLSAYKKQQFLLKTPVPILITYLTITVEDGLLVQHKDIYKLDDALESKMYAKAEQLTNIILKK